MAQICVYFLYYKKTVAYVLLVPYFFLFLIYKNKNKERKTNPNGVFNHERINKKPIEGGAIQVI